MISLCVGLFIGFIIFAVVIYVLAWKNVEFNLEKYLLNSIELVNLIPERIKQDLYHVEINEKEDKTIINVYNENPKLNLAMKKGM